MAKPILKWAGGKKQLLEEIKKRLPENFNNYFELFIGGGALAFDLMHKDTIINDINTELINFYDCLKKDYKKVLGFLDFFIKEYNKNPRVFYYILRDEYETMSESKSKYFKAARTLLINKTCFNGLYRVNSKNNFNVPWNQKAEIINLFDLDNLKSVVNFLKTVKIFNKSFDNFRDDIKKGDFVYLDPPYDKLNKTTFNSYNPSEFTREDQKKLRDFCDYINNVGAYFLVSNHSTEFILDIYKNYNIIFVDARRMINSNKNGRGFIKEVLISNF
ncbi:DNA adenine methylase [Spiroplasma helicoides]|uniref:Site-specific DNA-methyltransferase (adenine-specific) n=1 Tax=Spiroplasma helicoides TaxID=216938 RepID=A0A1B3SKD4_9MOLU|nr:Dam family site-specific DNA-(adenine-N6)-methyltransferase [Spiroplasma helicoides]AOG60387.1 DNA adenine methylase [Spiroplasma helicoides]